MAFLIATVLLCLSALFVVGLGCVYHFVRYRRLRAELDRRNQESLKLHAFLHDLTQLFSSEARERAVHRALLGGAREVLAASHAGLYRVDPETRRVVPLMLDAGLPPLVSARTPQPLDGEELTSWRLLAGEELGAGVLGKAALGADPVLIADLGQMDELDGHGARLRDGWSVILAPMQTGQGQNALLAVAREPTEPPYTEIEVELARSVAEQCAFALQSSTAHATATERRNLRAELDRAAQVQQVLVPRTLPAPPGWKLELRAQPARILSGDFHSMEGNGRPVLVVADVCGKGLGSALLGAMSRSSLSLALEEGADLRAAACRVNRRLYPDIREDMHVTLALVALGQDGDIEVLRAGHEAPLHYNAQTGEVKELVPLGLSLGIDPGRVFERVTQTLTTHLNAGDLLVVYTDGVTEAVSPDGEEYGPQRLIQLVQQRGSEGASGLSQALAEDHQKFTGDLPALDDITVVVLEKE